MFVPVTDDPTLLTSARPGEGDRPWSAGAGPTSLAVGLTESAWILSRLRETANKLFKTYLDWRVFSDARSGLFIWEAFVSGDAKGRTTDNDAQVSVRMFAEAMPDPERRNAVTSERVLSLIGAAIVWSGLGHGNDAFLSQPALVLKAQ